MGAKGGEHWRARAEPKPGGANEIRSSVVHRVVADAAEAHIALHVVAMEAMLSLQGVC